MQWIKLGGIQYPVEQLRTADPPAPLSAFGMSVVTFCREWLSGKEHFAMTTSGSTGPAKEIVIRRGQMVASALATAKALQLTAGDVALICLDPRFIAGKMMLVRCFVTGMNAIVTELSGNPFDLVSDNDKIDFTSLIPYQLINTLQSTSDLNKLNRLKAVIIGGGELNLNSKQKVATLAPAIYATYGMTETISHIALQKLNTPDSQDYFQVLDNIAIEKDDRGCLVIAADYLGPQKIVTNDLVEILSPERFRWLGRWDNIINSGGVKIIPEKVEKSIAAIFSGMNMFNRFFIAGVPDATWGDRVVLVVEGFLPPDIQSLLLTAIANELPKYERPKEIRIAKNFVETATGKVNRKRTLDQTTPPA